MALELRTKCEKCDASLPAGGIAFICAYECTFCENCSKMMDFICPNCRGELVRRPRKNAAGSVSA